MPRRPDCLISRRTAKFYQRCRVQLWANTKRKMGPREIDIDILFYSDQIMQEDKLVIPHPNLQERAFVLIPLNEIRAKF